MKQRIIGFDLARAYAIFGMFIVNFNFAFGSFQDISLTGKFLNLFIGNSTAIFIILAGIGVSLMTNRNTYSLQEQAKLKSVILKRSWFLLVLGLLLYSWWPGDILHFYGGYLHIAAFLLFVPKKVYLWIAASAILIFHLLLLIIPIDTSWNFETFEYADFWTPIGFLRNTFYNGWNSIFPWLAYFMFGMFVGRLDWKSPSTKKKFFWLGLIVFMLVEGLRIWSSYYLRDPYSIHYIQSEYFPAYLPFMLLTGSFAVMLISACMFITEKFPTHSIIKILAQSGRMSLSFYVFHITVGMLIFTLISPQTYTGLLTQQLPATPVFIGIYATGFYLFCITLSILWSRKFKHGPLEICMRKISG
jgi:uncharacterized protein